MSIVNESGSQPVVSRDETLSQIERTSFHISSGKDISLEEIARAARDHQPVTLHDEVVNRVTRSRSILESMVSDERVIYGVNTSMGGFVNYIVPIAKASELQNNLINAVATNVGKYFDDTTVRATMLARIVSLSRGNSAISIVNFKKLIEIYNQGIVPCIPEKGSLGTSGDLGPLAAIALVCTGQWKARYQGEQMSGAMALEKAGISPMELSFKEGLALINGTSAMVGLGVLLYDEVKRLFDTYLTVTSLSIEGLHGKTKPFEPAVHRMKPHQGQLEVATTIWETLADSSLAVNEHEVEKLIAEEMDGLVKASNHQIEDAYSIRCTPQILGPVADTLKNIKQTLTNELNSSNDNPLIDQTTEEVFHNGHFHGQYVSMAMDHLNIALVTMMNLANRRIDRFMDKSNSNGLPPFLCAENAGLRLGLMGGQFMTASITAESRASCMPMSIQSLSTTGDFQDIVSFGLVAARRVREQLKNLKYVFSFELLCACQAVDIRGTAGLSKRTRALYDKTRTLVPYLEEDKTISDYIESIAQTVLTKNSDI
ncbi:phenylalanine aminomutase (D-beta-phenylalanine forming) [Erwinia persicina]|uniref:AdmH n=2 Tax=Enterobacter agglomerans TaxID=549 RepID=Q84FL5_ENTAG|nr:MULTISPECIES: phenylalanine aminomutase (D-beta-phenylalanine forming) [Erwiniaceae]AAO39102.1 AdmH [Pantoea agglomerans]MBC3946711.1 phenylalanine aminomutase (D-beta-phenylalanine forming) [Erwinia persicina]MBK4724631.1 phenylalanine aminomutase (D-beta-phenylalanine forming) [Pantoea agglomerans]MEE4407124.1 phenylalanine aminomutase (D-beta-phenylalanine forming) [Enterobacter mori]